MDDMTKADDEGASGPELGSATLGESGARAMRDRIRAAWPGAQLVAPAIPVNCTPGVRVEITPNGPRYSAGALGFGSQVSRWLGAPHRKTNRTDFAFAGAAPNAEPPVAPSANGTVPANCRNDLRPTPVHDFA